MRDRVKLILETEEWGDLELNLTQEDAIKLNGMLTEALNKNPPSQEGE